MLVLDAAPGPVHALAFTPMGDLIAGGNGETITWGADASASRRPSANKQIGAIAVSPDGRLVAAGGTDRGLQIVQADRAVPRGIAMPGPVSAAAFVSPTRLAVGLGDRTGSIALASTLYFLDAPGFEPRKSSFGAVNGLRALRAAERLNRLAWATDNRLLVVQDVTRPATKPVVLKKDPRALAYSADGRWLAVASDWEVLVFDAERWPGVPRTLGRHQGIVSALEFTSDGQQLFTGGWDKTVRQWDVERGIELAAYAWPIGNRVTALAVSHDGLRAAVGGDTGAVVVWDLD